MNHLVGTSVWQMAIQFASEHQEDDLLRFAKEIDRLSDGAVCGVRSILQNDTGEEGGAPDDALKAAEAAEFLRSLARALRDSAKECGPLLEPRLHLFNPANPS
jgi:hypothetical protein